MRGNKDVHLRDFQVIARAPGFIGDEQRTVNEALFATYEPVRLWLNERAIKAPFRKLLVSFADETSSACWHGSVSVAAGICEVSEAVAISQLRENAKNHRWVIDAVKHALGCVAQEAGWRYEPLETLLEELSCRSLPLIHFFETLAETDDHSGVKCEPWLAVQPGLTQLGVLVSIPGEAPRDVILMSKWGSVYLEDDFPVAKSKIKDAEFLLLDKKGRPLASVPLKRSDIQ